MQVFLTGGTGLLGTHVARRLAERGHGIVALVRSTSRTSGLKRLGATLVTGDLRDSVETLARAATGCEATIHAAALVYRRGAGPLEYQAINVGGTERLLRAAGAAGAGRTVLVSSIAVYGSGPPGERYEESRWLAHPPPARVDYARSKRAAEEAAWRLHAEGLIRLTAVRPGVLYGEGDRWFTPALARIMRWPVVPLPGHGRHTVPVVYAGNAADGVLTALEREGAVGQAYNLSEDAPLTVRALLQNFARGLERRLRLVPVPAGVVRAAAVAGDTLLRMMPALRGTDLRRAARRILADNAYPSEKARRELGWAARVPPAEALRRTAGWWREAASRPDEDGER